MTPETPSDPPLQRAPMGRGEFTWAESGEGPAVIAVHGAPGSTRDFRWLGSAVEGIRFIRLDLPGYGGTDWSTGPGYTLAARARFVVAAAYVLGLNRYSLVGHSQGGGVATAAAAMAPEQVQSLALLASIGPRRHKGFLVSRVRLFGTVLRVPGLPWLLQDRLEAGFRRAGFPATLSHEQRVRTIKSSGAISFAAHARNLARLQCPTMVCWTEDDRLVEDAVSRDLAAAVPDGPRLSFPTGGHNLQKTRALEIGEALSGFVSESVQVRLAQ
ncbi:MAG: alpha/beta hydrolase [Deltaproteobacteria bacterium]|nr:alpha/beta hydrolase [Deltaproteobacteria bacterium]